MSGFLDHFLTLLVGLVLGLALVSFVQRHDHTLPGSEPSRNFIDEGREYSPDGCWSRNATIEGSYWYKQRHCHVVRLP